MGAVGGSSSPAKTSILMKNDNFQKLIHSKLYFILEMGDKRPKIKDNSILLWKANSLYKKDNSKIVNYIKEGKKLDRKWANNWAVTWLDNCML